MNIFDLDQNILGRICKYLCYVDRISLKFTCHTLNIRISGTILDFIPIIKKRLLQFLPSIKEVDKFLHLLSKFGVIISGSFILACLYNKDWFGDIDIYENYNFFKDFWHKKMEKIKIIPNRKLRNQKFTRVIKKIYNDSFLQSYPTTDSFGNLDFIESNVSYFYTFDHYYSYISKFLLNQSTANYNGLDSYKEAYVIRNFPINNTFFQHIYIGADPKKFIKHTFDMDICQNFFDGKQLCVSRWDKLIDKKDFIKPNALLLKFYLEHDTKDYSNEKAYKDDIYQTCLDKSEVRMKKYQERGFQIELHPKYDQIMEYIYQKKPNRTYAHELVNKDQVDISQF
jgi:hypothetical protein